MSITLPPLPFAKDALEPHISSETLQFHHGKHHKSYVDKTNKAIKGTRLENRSLEVIVRTAWDEDDQELFNNAAQAWNHDFFWKSLSPERQQPSDAMKALLKQSFGGLAPFRKAFSEAAEGNFASGWTWLCQSGDKLIVHNTDDAQTPLVDSELVPLITLDVWEHAYYIDYRNERPKFVAAFVETLLNWEFAEANLR